MATVLSKIRGIWKGFFPSPRPYSILRDILVERDQLDPTAEQMRQAALVVHRAKLNHLVGEVTPLEAQALADAGDLLEHEHRLRLVSALLNPAESFALVDGGEMKRKQLLAAAESESS